MAGNELKIALLGCGNIARAHLKGIREHAPRIKVTAAIDSDLERATELAERAQCPAFTSLDQAIEDGDFDAVDIMLPHDLHEAAAAKAFAAGKHVVLEKPMAQDLNSASRIVEIANASDGLFMIAEQAQYWPDVHEAKRLIDQGAIGRVLFARGCFYDPGVDTEEKPWRFYLERAGGGIVLDGGAHWIRPLRIWFGDVAEVVGITGRNIEAMEGESLAQAILRFESGLTASFDALKSRGATAPVDAFRITGSEGEITISHGRDGVMMLYNAEHPSGELVMNTFEGKVASYGLELKDFSDAVLDGTELAAPPEYSLGEMRTAMALYRSVESGKWEAVADV